MTLLCKSYLWCIEPDVETALSAPCIRVLERLRTESAQYHQGAGRRRQEVQDGRVLRRTATLGGEKRQ